MSDKGILKLKKKVRGILILAPLRHVLMILPSDPDGQSDKYR
jgi:hypothetical protein